MTKRAEPVEIFQRPQERGARKITDRAHPRPPLRIRQNLIDEACQIVNRDLANKLVEDDISGRVNLVGCLHDIPFGID